MAHHLLDLCEAFHAYHTKGGRDRALRVLSDDPPLRAARLALTDAVRQTLANGLHLLGIAAPPRMYGFAEKPLFATLGKRCATRNASSPSVRKFSMSSREKSVVEGCERLCRS